MLQWNDILLPQCHRALLVEVEAFEKQLGHKLPADYRTFLLTTNGGMVTVPHEMHFPPWYEAIRVQCLYPLSAGPPFIGIKECRELQVSIRYGFQQLLQIGGDAGTGFFFICLWGNQKGTIYFAYKDDLPLVSAEEWQRHLPVFPESLLWIANSFDALGEKILSSQS